MDLGSRGLADLGNLYKEICEAKNIRGNDSEEQKKRLEKKRGMKLDDHPQFMGRNGLSLTLGIDGQQPGDVFTVIEVDDPYATPFSGPSAHPPDFAHSAGSGHHVAGIGMGCDVHEEILVLRLGPDDRGLAAESMGLYERPHRRAYGRAVPYSSKAFC